MESRSVNVSDGISRFLGLGALVLCLGGGGYLYQANQQLKSELATLSATPNNPEAYQQFADEWDQKLTSALTEFNKRANESKNKFDEAREARNRLVNAAQQQSGGLTQAEVKELIKAQLAQLQLPESAPELLVATTVKRPVDGETLSLPSIRNVGTVDAEIRAARFKPKKGSEFVVKSSPRSSDRDQVVIEYVPNHNKDATVEGAHRFYERTYILPEQVVAQNKTAEVVVEIRANNRHLDWGMAGDLELEYQDGRTVLIPNARAIFVPDPEETT